MLVVLGCRDYSDARAFESFWGGMKEMFRGGEPGPVVSVEDIARSNPDKSNWESFCGKYEHPGESDFIIDEVYMKDGELYANASIYGDETSFRLYPIGEN